MRTHALLFLMFVTTSVLIAQLKVDASGNIGIDTIPSSAFKLNLLGRSNFVGETHITSLSYIDNDIVVEDKDGDGYYYWGLSKPSFITISDTLKDGNDSDPTLGSIDDYGNLKEITDTMTYSPTIYDFNINLYSPLQFFGDIIIESGGQLRVCSKIFMTTDSQIVIKDGGQLIVPSAGLIRNANIKVESGGSLVIEGNGVIEKSLNDSIDIEVGATFDFTYGEIK